jgi:hypothetical protein
LLALFLVSIFVAQQRIGYEPATEIAATVPSLTGDMVTDDQHTPDSTMIVPTPTTPNATVRDPQRTLTPSADLPFNATIQLSGPPPDSSFYLNDPMSIYWSWPLELTDDQQFAIYLLIDQTKYLAGIVQEPALGNQGYQLKFDPGNMVEDEGTYQLEVRLERKRSQTILVASSPRTVSFVLLPES